jgi:NADP-dependent 3-hydroxy acid dehydrogenase YdfG
LIDNFFVIKTSKDVSDINKLDILDVQSIENFIKNYLETYGKKPIKAIFLNSGIMNV